MSEPTAPPPRPWRPMAAWTAGIAAVLSCLTSCSWFGRGEPFPTPVVVVAGSEKSGISLKAVKGGAELLCEGQAIGMLAMPSFVARLARTPADGMPSTPRVSAAIMQAEVDDQGGRLVLVAWSIQSGEREHRIARLYGTSTGRDMRLLDEVPLYVSEWMVRPFSVGIDRRGPGGAASLEVEASGQLFSAGTMTRLYQGVMIEVKGGWNMLRLDNARPVFAAVGKRGEHNLIFRGKLTWRGKKTGGIDELSFTAHSVEVGAEHILVGK